MAVLTFRCPRCRMLWFESQARYPAHVKAMLCPRCDTIGEPWGNRGGST